MNGVEQTFLYLITFVVFLYILIIVTKLLSTKNKPGLMTVNGNEYKYELGDKINILGIETRCGIDVVLPKKVPHIYLDSHSDSKIRGPAYYIDGSQAVKLEGDFNKYFQAFIAKGSQLEGLSFLTPDFMLTLIENSELFDVELYSNHLRIFTKKPVYNNQEREKNLIYAAHKIMLEIDHKLKTWDDHDLDNGNHNLLISRDKTIKLGGRYLRIGHVLVGMFRFMCLTLFVIGINIAVRPRWSGDQRDGIMLCAMVIFIYLVTYYGLIKEMGIKLFRPKY